MNFLKKQAKYILAGAFNILLFYCLISWLVQNIHLHSLWSEMTRVKFFSFSLVALFEIFISFVYASRLKLLLSVPFLQAWSIISIGNGLNNVLPFRMGDILRIYYGKHYYNVQLDKLIAATFMERYCDLILLLMIGFTAVLTGPKLYDTAFIYILSILFTCGVLSIVIYRSLITPYSWLQRLCCRSTVMTGFLESLTGIISSKTRKHILLLTAFIWLGTVCIYYVFFSVNLPAGEMTIRTAAILCFTTTLAFAIPYVVAGIGIFESAIIYYLIHFLHIAPTYAVALALVYHFMFALPQIILMGVVFILRKMRTVKPNLIAPVKNPESNVV